MERNMRRRQGILSKDLRWPKPMKAAALRAAVAEAGMTRFIAESGGLPRIVKPKSVKDEATGLLRIAAEVEHALMVQYLYAAFTLGPNADPKYRRDIVLIAKQEMGHFVTVQNLLRLLGASPHLDRDDLLPGSGKEPAAFMLEPVTVDSLAKYTVIESPLDERITGNAKIIYDRAKARIDAQSMTQLNRVGALYAAIYWLFMEQDEPEPDEPWPLNPEEILRQNPGLKGRHLKKTDFADAQEVSALITSRNDWIGGPATIFVDETTDRKTAKSALFNISSQGEGVSEDPATTSHFQRFLKLFAAAELQPPEVIAVPVGKSKAAANKAAQTVMEFFNTRYQILLLLIDVALRIPNGNASLRPTFTNLAIDEMQKGVRDTAKAMLKLQAGPTNGPVAPPFELPGGAWPEDSLPDVGAGIARLRRLLTMSRKLDETLRAIAPGVMKDELDSLKGHDIGIEEAIGNLPSS
jgi:Ferritin-like